MKTFVKHDHGMNSKDTLLLHSNLMMKAFVRPCHFRKKGLIRTKNTIQKTGQRTLLGKRQPVSCLLTKRVDLNLGTLKTSSAFGEEI